MPVLAPCGAGQLVRPLLGVRRAQLEALVHAQGLSWSEDPSNRAEHFDRNYLRPSACACRPLLALPSAAATVSRSAALMAEASRGSSRRPMSCWHRRWMARPLSVRCCAVCAGRAAPGWCAATCVHAAATAGSAPFARDHRPVLACPCDGHTLPALWRGRDSSLGTQLLARRRLPPLTAHVFSWRWAAAPTLQLGGARQLKLLPDAHGPIRLAALPGDSACASAGRGAPGDAPRVTTRSSSCCRSGTWPVLRAPWPVIWWCGREYCAVGCCGTFVCVGLECVCLWG